MLHYIHAIIANPPLGSTSGPVSVETAADVLVFAPWRPVRIIRWGFICTSTVNDATNALALTLDLRPTAGSNVSRTTGASTILSGQTGWNASALPQFFYDLAGGSMTFAAGASQIAAGKAAFHEVASQKPSATYSPYYPDPDTAFDSPGGVNTQFVIYPGQEAVIAVQAVAPAAGAGKFFLEIEEQAFEGNSSNNKIAVSGIPSSIIPTPSDPGVWTRFLS